MNKTKVVVTGIGFVTPTGNTISKLWGAISSGLSKEVYIKNSVNKPDKFLQLAVDAAKDAIVDSDVSKDILSKAGITISSSKGGIAYIGQYLREKTDDKPMFWNKLYVGNYYKDEIGPQMAAVRCAARFGCKGPSLNVISACATGLNSIIMGAEFIKTKRAKVVLAGGTDACLTEFMVSAYKKLGVLAKDLCRPYDVKRSGFLLSEGAAVVVLEEKEHAQRRGAKIYCEITGYASLGDGYSETSINPNAKTIEKAIRLTCMNLETIDYINTHGTGTWKNDKIETLALKNTFGTKILKIPVSSTKPITGHMLGASGALEFIICILAMENNFIPPTLNLTEHDHFCDLDYTPIKGKRHNIKKALTLSYGFGGHIAAAEISEIR